LDAVANTANSKLWTTDFHGDVRARYPARFLNAQNVEWCGGKIMNSSVKTLSLLHNIIMGVCAAILAFSTSPDKADSYRSLLRDLIALHGLQMEEYPPFAASAVPEPSATLLQEFVAALEKEGYPTVSADFYIPKPVYAARPTSDSAISELIPFFEGDNQVSYVKYDPNGFKMRESVSVRSQLYKYSSSCIPTHIALRTDGKILRMDRTIILSGAPSPMLADVYVSLVRSADDMNCGMEIPAQVTATVVTLRSNFARNWLATKGIQPGQLLPRLSSAEDQIGAKTLEGAITFLDRELNTKKRELTFLGLKIDAATAIWIGPVTTLTLVLYFLAHLRHFRMTINRHDNQEGYSWIGLFVDRLSTLITYASIVLLPTIANLVLMIASKDVETVMRPVVITCTLAILACGILGGAEIHTLHRIIRTDSLKPGRHKT
jgi:hypothetical protein